MISKENVYTVDQYAKLTGKSRRTIRRWIKDGKISYRRTEGKYGKEYMIYPKGLPKDVNPSVNSPVQPGHRHDIGQEGVTKNAKTQENVNTFGHDDMGSLQKFSQKEIVEMIQAKGQVELLKSENEFLRSQLSKPGKKNFGLFMENFWRSLNKRFFKEE